ncbi:hypothetical protein [Limimaricola pyoseonensis]|uniref:Flagellar export protein FliJ n=1 Tax=Limimaricola pyoseonensis TaxID=521013 RepID=A0A1G7KAB7_9RHOB|nr:hypothetical protein [Limimaricola pyoseonensis]SDF33904.1 flagellar export protein FliJ [Limimaricola pyoseonensis]
MADRRVRALALLERLGRLEVEARVTELQSLHARMDELQAKSRETGAALERDGHIVSIESAPYVGDYIRSARAEIGRLDQARAALEPEARALEDEMRDRFREMKTHAKLAQRLEARHAEARAAQEAAQAEESALQRWMRLRDAAQGGC